MKYIILDSLNTLLSKKNLPKDIRNELTILKKLVESSNDDDFNNKSKKVNKWEVGKRIADITIILYKLFKDT